MTIKIILYIRALYSHANAFNNNFETCITQSDEFVNFKSDYAITNANKDEEFRNEACNILDKELAFEHDGNILQTQKQNEYSSLCDNRLSNAPNLELNDHDAGSNKNKRKTPSANTLNCTVSALHGKKKLTEKVYDFYTDFFKFPSKNLALSDEYSIKLNYKCANDSILKFNTETLELNKSPICSTCEIYESFEEIKFQIYLKDATLCDKAQKYHNISQINVNMLFYRCNELMYHDSISNKYFCDIKKLLNLQQKTLKIDFESDIIFLDEKNFSTTSVASDILYRNMYWFENDITIELFISEMCCTTLKNDENLNLLNLNLDYEKGLCQFCLKKILMKLLFVCDTNTHKLHLKTIYYYLLLCVDDFLYIIWFILFNKETNECPYYVCKMFFNDMGNPEECSKNVSVNILRAFLAETFIINHRILVESFQTAKITPKKNLLNNQYYNLKYSYHKKNAFNNVKKFDENLMFMLSFLYLTPTLSISYISLFYNTNNQRQKMLYKLHRFKHSFVFFMHLLKETEQTEPIYNMLSAIQSSRVYSKTSFDTASFSEIEYDLFYNNNGFISQQNLCYGFICQILGLTFNDLKKIMLERQYNIAHSDVKEQNYGKPEIFNQIPNNIAMREIVYKIFYPNDQA